MHFKNRLDWAWFSKFSEEDASLDNAWVFLWMCPTGLFQIKFDRAHLQTVPGWSAFHTTLPVYPAIPTNTGYCQAIQSPSSNFNTVYTVIERAESMFA